MKEYVASKNCKDVAKTVAKHTGKDIMVTDKYTYLLSCVMLYICSNLIILYLFIIIEVLNYSDKKHCVKTCQVIKENEKGPTTVGTGIKIKKHCSFLSLFPIKRQSFYAGGEEGRIKGKNTIL